MNAEMTLKELERRVESARMISRGLDFTAGLSKQLPGRIDSAKLLAEQEDYLYASIELDTVRKYLEHCEKGVRNAVDKTALHEPEPDEAAVDCAGKFRELADRISPLRSKIMERNPLLHQEIVDDIEKLSEEAQEIHRALPSVKTGLLNRVCP